MHDRTWFRRLLHLTMTLGVIVPLTSVPASATDPAYVTIMFGRSQWVSTVGCAPMPGSIDLLQIAQELASRGLSATGLVVTTATQETTRYCHTDIAQHASWTDLAMLRDAYGWTFDSTGSRHGNMSLMTPQQQLQESCGSLAALRDHGHLRSGAFFGYPNNVFDTTMQANVVSTCFTFGRRYALAGDPQANTRDAVVADGGLQWTLSMNGNQPVRYTPRSVLAAAMNPAPGEWRVVQAYRFVTGSRSGAGSSWDCTSANPAEHWTSRAELYCWDDFRWALDQIGDGVTVADPRTVGDAWFPPTGPDTTAPVPVVASPAVGAQIPLPATVSGSASDAIGVTQVEIAIRNNTTLQWWTGSGWGTFRYVPVTLASPGATVTAWSYAFAPPAGGTFGYQVRARDAAGNVSAATRWRTFRGV